MFSVDILFSLQEAYSMIIARSEKKSVEEML